MAEPTHVGPFLSKADLALALLIALACAAAVSVAPLRSVAVMADDALVRVGRVFPPPALPGVPDASVVAIDANSMRALPGWPWPRALWGELIGILEDAGARAIAFDIDFSSARDPRDNEIFGAAIRESGKVVLGALRETQTLAGVGRVEVASFPVPEIRSGAAALGAAMVPLDRDGVVRSAKPVTEIGGKRLPSMAHASWLLVSGQGAEWDDARPLPIDFRRADVPVVPLLDLMEGRVEAEHLAGRVVFVGATAPILQDLWATPNMALPGVLIQAIEYRTHAARALGRDVFRVAGWPTQLGVALAVSLLAAALGALSETWRPVALLGLAGLVLGGCVLALVHGDLLVAPFAPISICGVHYVAGLETVRRRIGRRVAEQARSLDALLGASRLSAARVGRASAEHALELLGDAVDADWLVLMPLSLDGSLDAEGVSWTRAGRPPSLELEPGYEALAARERRAIEARSGTALWVPLLCADEPVGLIAAGFAADVVCDADRADTVESVGGRIAQAMNHEELVHELRNAIDEAQVASRAKTELLANVSHEIRTPMTALLGDADLLIESARDRDEMERRVASIRAHGRALLTRVDSVLDLAELESGRLELAKEPVDVTSLVQAVTQRHMATAEAAGLALSCSVAPDLPPRIRTDGRRVEQVIDHLVRNAIEFTGTGSVRVVATQRQRRGVGMLEVAVRDTGPGIPEDQVERLFEPFVQADTSSTRRHGGLGIGLAVCRRLVYLLGGAIRVEAQAEGGTCFRFAIPLEIPSEVASDAAPVATEPVDLSDLHVLVADDGRDNRRILGHFLRKAGLRVAEAENGREAVEKVVASADAGDPVALIFMDIDMPVLDGYGATRELRELGYVLPIVALTAHALPTDRARCLNAGFQDHATKPIAREDLVGLVQRWVASSKAATA